jgi:hypothetical protein
LITWFWLRQAAILRHQLWNMLLEDGDKDKWKAHEAAIKAFYGF